jgi:hypothetical protein
MHQRPLDLSHLEAFLWEVSLATLEDGGVTCNVLTHQFLPPIDAWGLPRYPEKTLILLPGSDMFTGLCRFVTAHANALSAPDAWLGTWIHPETSCCHIDITELCSTFEEARTRALLQAACTSRSILALYHFKQRQTLYVHDEACSQRVSQ